MDSEVIILYISENIPRDLMDDRQSDMFHPCPAESTLRLFSTICRCHAWVLFDAYAYAYAYAHTVEHVVFNTSSL